MSLRYLASELQQQVSVIKDLTLNSGVVIGRHTALEMAPSVTEFHITSHLPCWAPWSVNFISLVTSYVKLREEEPQTAFPMSITWASHIAANVLTGH